jgi:hypothetical protein
MRIAISDYGIGDNSVALLPFAEDCIKVIGNR